MKSIIFTCIFLISSTSYSFTGESIPERQIPYNIVEACDNWTSDGTCTSATRVAVAQGILASQYIERLVQEVNDLKREISQLKIDIYCIKNSCEIQNQ